MVEPKDVFNVINDAVNVELRKRFGPPGSAGHPENMTALVAVATMQLSLRYFAETAAPKEVVRDFFDKLVGEDEKPAVLKHTSGSSLILPPHLRSVK